ncbi:hypothetical protein C8Q77DRAFT_646208 [Trametes polyzona]|nr:hypothetical protein C8Q77DRAFT_646208 [Trametes polyzona]
MQSGSLSTERSGQSHRSPLSLLVLATLALSALAQQATIVSPAAGSTIIAGSAITIEVHQDASATDDVQISALIGFQPCQFTGSADCSGFDPSTSGVGTIVFAGDFMPARDPKHPQKGPFQDFNFTIPSSTPIGKSVFTLGHLHAVGAQKIPVFDLSTVVVNVV